MSTAGATDESELLPRHAYRALLYVEKLNNVGVQPRVEDVEAFAVLDPPRETQYRSAFPALSVFPSSMLASKKVADAEPVTA